VACAIHRDREIVLNQVQSQYWAGFDRNHAAWTDSQQLRNALGKAAKVSCWFKRQSWAQEWINAIGGHLDDPAIRDTDFVRKLNAIREWIDRA